MPKIAPEEGLRQTAVVLVAPHARPDRATELAKRGPAGRFGERLRTALCLETQDVIALPISLGRPMPVSVLLPIVWLALLSQHSGPRQVSPGDPLAAFWTTTPSGLAYHIKSHGRGPAIKAGDQVTMHETLSLPDGRVVFSSRTAGHPVSFTMGANQVIPGVEEGVTGMRTGELRLLLVPPRLDGRTLDPAILPPASFASTTSRLSAGSPAGR
jgi:hypothetical protein